MLIPGRPTPPLRLPLVGGGSFDLAEEQPKHFTLVVFYRGFHCPICHEMLVDLEARLPSLEALGVGAVAVSADEKGRATRSKQDWGLEGLRVGYGLDGTAAKAWGLFESSHVFPDEPDSFFEPALFLVRKDGKLYGSSVNSMPFARASLADLLQALDIIIQTEHPPRGTIS